MPTETDLYPPEDYYWDSSAWSTKQKIDFWLWFFAFCPVCLLFLGQEPEGRYRRLSWEERAQRRAAERNIRERMSRWIEAEPDLFRVEARPALASFLARHPGERVFIEDSHFAWVQTCPSCGAKFQPARVYKELPPDYTHDEGVYSFDGVRHSKASLLWQQCPRCLVVFERGARLGDPYFASYDDYRLGLRPHTSPPLGPPTLSATTCGRASAT